MGHETLNQYCKIKSYCKSEGLNTEHFIISNSNPTKHTGRKKVNGWLSRGR